MLILLWRAKVGQILNSGKRTFCFIVLPCEIVSALFLVLSADIFYITNVLVKAFLLHLGHHVLDSGCSLISSNAEPKEQQASAEWLLELLLTESLRLVVARAWVCDWWLPGPESVIGGCQGLSLWLVVARAWVCDWWLPGAEKWRKWGDVGQRKRLLVGFPGGSEVKASAHNAGDLRSIPALGKSPGESHGPRNLQAPLSKWFSIQEYWRGLPFPTPGCLPDLQMEPMSPALAGEFFYHWDTWRAHKCYYPPSKKMLTIWGDRCDNKPYLSNNFVIYTHTHTHTHVYVYHIIT